MKSIRKALLFGLAVWVIPFVVAILIFPLRANERPLFESIMPVVVTVSVVLFANFYFKQVEVDFIREGILLGVIWLLISIAIDMLMFSSGPMKMSFIDYMKDIGLTYLIMPTITIGFAYQIQRRLT